MAALTALAIAAGVGSMAYGLYESNQGREQAEAGYALQQQGAQLQAQAAQQQAGISKEQAASSVVFAGKERDVNLLASQQSIAASNQSYGINQNIITSEQGVEQQKQNAMELDARRQQMEIIRNQQRGRALSLATGVAQGGGGFVGGSSARGGAYGQISGQTGVNLLGVQQQLEVGRNIFGLNTNISNQRIAGNELEHTYALQQAANQTTKSNITYDYAVVNAGYQTRFADTQTLMSQGAGLIAQGGGQVGMGQAMMSQGNSFISAGPSLFSMGMNSNQLFGTSPAGYTPGYNPSPLMRMFG